MQLTPTQYWTIITIALLLSGVLTVAWRTVRRRRMAGETAVLTPPSWIEMWWQSGWAVWQEEIVPHERNIVQVTVAIAAILISLSIGYAYGDIPLIVGWQFVTWALAVLILLVVLMPSGAWPLPQNMRWRWLGALAIVAVLLRLPFLDSVPGGLHVDEMGVAGYAMRHLFPPQELTINPFHTATASQPVLYHYIIRISFAIFGYTFTALRGLSALAGVFGVICTFFLVATFDSRRTAWITAVLMTTYHYHVHWSRIGLNNIFDTVWVPLTLAAFAYGYRKDWSGGAVIAGAALGISQYFYAGSKVLIFLVPALAWLLWRETPSYKRMWIHFGKLSLTAIAIGAPITLFALILPDVYFNRSRTVMGWTEPTIVATIGKLDYGEYLWHQIWRNVGAFTAVPEVTGFYGPGIPYLIGVAAPLFVIGVVAFFWYRQWIPLLWLFFALLLGGVLISGAPSSSHHVVMIPVICWATAVPLNWLWQQGRWGIRIALFFIALIIATDLIFYFGIYVPRGPRDLFNDLPELPFQ